MRKLFVLAAFTNVCLSLAAQIPTPSIVNDPAEPVKIISTQASINDLVQGITVDNTSDRPVVSLKLGLIISIPAVCGADASYVTREHTRTFDLAIAAGSSATIQNIGVRPAAIQRLLQQHHAVDAMPQLTIVGVEFASGPPWQMKKNGTAYDDTRVAADAVLRCSRSSVAPMTLAKKSCPDGKLVIKVGMGQGYNGQYYSCAQSNGQFCQMSSTVYSCTNNVCTDKNACPNQFCQLNGSTGGGGGGGGGPYYYDPGDPSSGGCDPADLYCGCPDPTTPC